jgi:hypothetical protein
MRGQPITMTATPTTEKFLVAFQTPQGTLPWLSPPPLPQSRASGYSIEFMSMPLYQHRGEADPQGTVPWLSPPPLPQSRASRYSTDESMSMPGDQRGDEADLVDVLEQVSGMTLEGPVVRNKASQNYPLRTPFQESRLLFTGGGAESLIPAPPPLPPALSSSAAVALTPALRHKRQSSHHFTPVDSEAGLISPQYQRVAMIRPKRYRSSSIVSKMDTCPLLPTSPDLSEAGEIRHEPCFSPVYQSSMAHLPIPSVPREPLTSITSATAKASRPPPPAPILMPLFGSPNMDKRKVSASIIHPLKMRKVNSTYAFPH